ncbi:hypothetical protein [Streptomyces cucumeris]|uniref:hypothetical protein n=1 Tax=Streptomyces cucumeris TaxID=2962890 RepID=UPI003D715F13
MTAVANDQRTGRSPVSEELFDGITHFVAVHDAQPWERAERIADQAIAIVDGPHRPVELPRSTPRRRPRPMRRTRRLPCGAHAREPSVPRWTSFVRSDDSSAGE